MKRKAKVVVEVTFSDLRLMRESLLALRNRLIAEGRHTAPVDEMLERLFSQFPEFLRITVLLPYKGENIKRK